MSMKLTRRNFTIGAAGVVTLGMMAEALAVQEPVEDLKPGEWAWYPERAESGPVFVIVSLSDQLAFVYRNGVRIGVSTVSSGKKGHETPTGVFTVLRKEKMHHSSKYNNAPMPDSQFFFGGCALHAGGLPGYPSSHGCVHLPRPFADRLFQVTHNGSPVIVTNERSGVGGLSHAGLVLSENELESIEKLTGHVAGKSLPSDEKGDDISAFSIVVSAHDRKLYGISDGALILEEPVTISNPRWPIGTHVYVFQGHDKAQNRFDWLAVGLGTGDENRVNQQMETAVRTRINIPPSSYAVIAQNLHPGSTYMITDLAAHPATRSDVDFVIMRDKPEG